MKRKNKQKYGDIVEILLDENNTEPIILYNDDEQYSFEQIAVIPHNDLLYAILKPIETIAGIKDDEAIVFKVDQNEDGESFLTVEENEEEAIKVFDKYLALLNEKTESEEK